MLKIRKIAYKGHPILGDLVLNFCDSNGKAVDTVLFAGENGTGKSTILNSIYNLTSSDIIDHIESVEIEQDGEIHTLSYYDRMISGNLHTWVKDECGLNTVSGHNDFFIKYPLTGIFSDVEIVFQSKDLYSVTSMSLDTQVKSKRSDNNLPNQVKQLMIDIQALDDAELATAYRAAKLQNHTTDGIVLNERMHRFTNAFASIFDSLAYCRIDNVANHKSVVFQKYGKEVTIDNLSSGEKQIVYRGCFMLKDKNAMNGAIVFIDEPEISLHPSWQIKIMDFYKEIFTNENREQTSQIFAVTHSPFVIHNENRKNDKVIVLSRNKDGKICVNDKPEYFKCTSEEVVQDAFSIRSLTPESSSVYLEGRTDEKYFRKAAEVFGYNNLPFEFHWVGYMKDEINEENSGKDALNKAVQFLVGRNLTRKQICLFDCDTKRSEVTTNNIYTKVVPFYSNIKGMKIGIENALVLDEIDTSPFYSKRTKEGEYADNSTIVSFEKMKFCDYICSLDNKTLLRVFANLKTLIENLQEIING